MKVNILLLLAILTCSLYTCSFRDIDISNLNNNKVLLIGHAGAGFREFSYADNSLESFDKAIEGYGVDGVEMDIQLSRDSVLYLFHNSQLESMTNCHGCIAENPSTELTDCKYTPNFHIKVLRNQYLTSMRKVFEKYANDKFRPYFILDLKDYPDCYSSFATADNYKKALVDQIVNLVHEFKVQERVIAEVNSPVLVTAFRTRDASIRLLWNCADPAICLTEAVELGLEGIMVKNENISAEQVAKAHDANLWVSLFSIVTEQDNKDAIRKSPEIIITDNIQAAGKYLNR